MTTDNKPMSPAALRKLLEERDRGLTAVPLAGVWMPAVVVLQFFAKVAGGAVWAVMVSAFASRTTQGENK